MDMSMTTSTAMAASTTSMAMASSTSSSSTSMTSMMSMSDMTMSFFTSTTTPLFSAAWTPMNKGQYAGTCIFLIILALIFRGLFAFRSYLEATVWARRGISTLPYPMRIASPTGSTNSADQEDGNGELEKSGAVAVSPLQMGRSKVQPWRISVDGSRAILDVITVGVGYLLMVAVMTMNVGYFMSILGGTFLGSLLTGRYEAISSAR